MLVEDWWCLDGSYFFVGCMVTITTLVTLMKWLVLDIDNTLICAVERNLMHAVIPSSSFIIHHSYPKQFSAEYWR